MSDVFTRFAPSPTGYLHIGGVRTALLNFIFTEKSKKQNKDSKFFLRIEDTDKKRSDIKYENSIKEGLNWLGIKWDAKIYKQSTNIKEHIKIANQLLKNDFAYKCICKPEDLKIIRENNLKKGKSAKRLCISCEQDNKIQSLEKNYCIRLKISSDSYTEIKDKIQGTVRVKNEEIENFVILRNDSTPTYMLSVVVDDHFMGITHVIRGDDHLNNAFKQYQIYKNLNWKIPQFAHIPLIHGNDGSKLSKRHGAINMIEFRNNGFLPEAILNYLLNLGISNITKEFFTINEFIESFNLNKILKAPSKFDYDKLNYINSYYLRNMENTLIIDKLNESYNLNKSYNDKIIDRAINIFKIRSKNLFELQNNISAYLNIKKFDNIEISKSNLKILSKFYNKIYDEKDWSKENIEEIIKEFVKKNNIKFSEFGISLRMILTGLSKGPSISEIFYILGRNIVLKKINDFLM